MKPLASRRSASGRSSVDDHPEKINRLHREIDVRRWKALRKYVELQEQLGRTLNRAELARKKGHETGNMVSLMLSGRAAVNETWMLHIAGYYFVAPQVIWGEDWPFPQLTPDFSDCGLHKVCSRWDALNANTRKKIISLASSTQNQR